MITKDGYEIYEGMTISKNNNNDVIYEITKVKENYVWYRELHWNEDVLEYINTGDGGLLFAEEIKANYEYL
jgi:hypothetical protein